MAPCEMVVCGTVAALLDTDAMTMFSVLAALVPPVPRVQVNAGVDVPEAVAVPLMTPVDVLSERPVGNEPEEERRSVRFPNRRCKPELLCRFRDTFD